MRGALFRHKAGGIRPDESRRALWRIGKNWHLPLNAANTTREDFDILYEYDVLLRKCRGSRTWIPA